MPGYTRTPYVNYVDESAYFTDNASFVHSFMTKYDDLWTNTPSYANYANVTGALDADLPDGYIKDPQLNFPPARVVREPGGRPVQRRERRRST